MCNKKSLRQAEQLAFPLTLPIIKGNKDYDEQKDLLKQMDVLLTSTGIEDSFVESVLAKAESFAMQKTGWPLRLSARLRIQKQTRQALRCNIARILSLESFRDFSFHLGDSHLLQKFCRLIEFDKVRVPSKSLLQKQSEMFDEAEIRQMITEMILSTQTGSMLGLNEKPDLSMVLMDSTCVELDIHFPVDWVLLRDGVRTLTKSIDRIREHGITHRIKEPSEFRSQMNRYCMAMTQAKMGEKAARTRKSILRSMKKLSKCVSAHATRYRDLLAAQWSATDLSEKEARVIIKRIDNVLIQFPAAIEQAHERIIGGRLVKNEDKILSLYEPHAQVYHRGKAGSMTEFGLQLLIAESRDGLILDFDLVEGTPKNDTQHLKPCLERIKVMGIHITGAVSDRGFVSAKNSRYLDENKITDHLCPRNVIQLQERLQQKEFVEAQKRRAQTEGRIGILKNCFLGQVIPVKGIERQKKYMAWSMLSHNLWLIARRLHAQAKQEVPLQQAA